MKINEFVDNVPLDTFIKIKRVPDVLYKGQVRDLPFGIYQIRKYYNIERICAEGEYISLYI